MLRLAVCGLVRLTLVGCGWPGRPVGDGDVVAAAATATDTQPSASPAAAVSITAERVDAVLRDLAVTFVGGSEYESLASYAWLFTLEGTFFAALQMVVYRQIARQAHVAMYLWAAAAVVAVLGILIAEHNKMLVGIVIGTVVAAALPVTLAKASGRASMPPTVPEG